jgi:predicted secreted protein
MNQQSQGGAPRRPQGVVSASLSEGIESAQPPLTEERRGGAGFVFASGTTPVGQNVVCASDGDVKIGTAELPEITKWSFKPEVSVQEYASNKTSGFKRKVCGSHSATGTIEGKFDRTDPITTHFQEGSTVVLTLIIITGQTITVPAIIKSLDFEVDINENAIVSWSAEYESDGAYTYNFTPVT